MLLGEHEHTIDDKNRLTLPAKFRHVFADGIVVTRGMDGCLVRLHARRLGAADRRPARRPRPAEQGRPPDAALLLLRRRSRRSLDKQGRVILPAALLEHAKLGRDVVVAGVHDHLEIWDRAAWRRELAEVEGSAEDVAERLAAKRD